MIELNKKAAWQQSLSNLITDPQELITLLGLDASYVSKALEAAKLFPLRVTRSYVARMQKNDPNDPLLKQVLPLDIECKTHADYQRDPLQEQLANPIPGLLHKYHGRVLMTLTGVCAVHCRYCFRRHFPYAENNPGKLGWEAILNYIQQDSNITEVILSGGDPLAVSDKLLMQFTEQLQTIGHVKRLRIHSRLPIVLPERITKEFLAWISALPLQKVIVIHANHAQEINEQVNHSFIALHHAGVTLLNQSVLLKGINDNVKALTNLSEILFAGHVLPYYLHTLDKVEGAMHFDTPIAKAQALHEELRKKLPGYLVPKLVKEQPGFPYKTLI